MADVDDNSGLEEITQRMNNMEPAFRSMGEELLFLTEERFNREDTPSGEAWPPLDPEYKKRKRNDSILTETGQMSEDNFDWQLKDDGVEVGGTKPSQRDKMVAHNFGADETVQVPAHTRTITQAFGKPIEEVSDDASGGSLEVQVDSYQMNMNIPQRTFLDVSDRYAKRLFNILTDWIVDGE